MSSADEQLKIYAVGKRTVLGFGGQEILGQTSVAEYRDHLLSLIEEHAAETVAFDLSGIVLIPSGMLGLLASLREHNVTVELFNLSDDIREVLTITRLDELLKVCDGPALAESDGEPSNGTDS